MLKTNKKFQTMVFSMPVINEINDYDYWYTVLEDLFKGVLSFIIFIKFKGKKL